MARQNTPSTHWTDGVCRANGINIHYLRTGGNKPTIIALHGLAGNGVCWSPVARALEPHYDIIMPDARGHGQSSAPLHGYTYQDHANDVIELIRTLGIKSPYLLGHSMGGMTAAMVASRLGLAVSGVILADPTFISAERQAEVYQSQVVAEHRQMLQSSKEALFKAAKSQHRFRAAAIIEHLIEARLQTSLQAFDVLIPPNPEFDELIRNIYVPTLMVLGSEGIVSAQTARALHRINPDLQYKVIQDAGHGLPYDEPARLAAAIHAFLKPKTMATPRIKPASLFSMHAASYAY
jgi:pimeloyl-ACP methyl ester carboxylesterase